MMQWESAPGFPDFSGSGGYPLETQPLSNEDRAEVERFLEARPLHTVFLSSLIRDNGVVSPLNRGIFYGCRNDDGSLEGVALLGHATIFETGNPECIQAFASLSKDFPNTHLIRGEPDKIESFWNFYGSGRRRARLFSRELLLEKQSPAATCEPVPALRQATLADLEMVVNANAAMMLHESGINPLIKDRTGFYERIGRRIWRGRIWLLVEDDQLVFKSDIIAENAHAAYLEGVYVASEKRRQRYGLRCLSQLTNHLLSRTKTVCLTVNVKLPGALRFYERVGYQVAGSYDTIYLQN